MLIERLATIRRADREAGFTLVELLVTMIAGIVVLMATLACSTCRCARTPVRPTAFRRRRSVARRWSVCSGAALELRLGDRNPRAVGQRREHAVVHQPVQLEHRPGPVLHKVTLNGTTLSDTTYALCVPTGTTDVNGWQSNPANWTFADFNTASATGYTNLITNVYPLGSGRPSGYYQYVNGQIAIDSTHLITAPLTATTPRTSER